MKKELRRIRAAVRLGLTSGIAGSERTADVESR